MIVLKNDIKWTNITPENLTKDLMFQGCIDISWLNIRLLAEICVKSFSVRLSVVRSLQRRFVFRFFYDLFCELLRSTLYFIYPIVLNFQKKNVVTRHFLYLESALCFLECGLAMEREQYNDASKMYKDTCMFVQ